MPALPPMSGGAKDGLGRGHYARAFEEKTRKLAQAAQAQTEKALSLEATVASLTDRLLESEASVRMLRTQLRRLQQNAADPAKLRAAKNLHAGLPASKPGARVHGASSASSAPPLRLPKLGPEGGGHGGAGGPPPRLSKGARDEAQREEERQLRALHKVREEGFVTAFPDYGGKTRSGLRGIGQTRIEENRQERERRRKEEKREKHLRALHEHGLSPSKRHERVLAEEAAAIGRGD